MQDKLEFKINEFHGPLDLLLHLIEKNKFNIFDIPIVEITEQYLEYVNAMQESNLDIMSEFLVMAATLISIKAKMLLPKEEEEEELGTPVNYEIYLKSQNSVVNIRKGPGKEYAVAGNIRNRQKYTIIKEHEGWGYLSTQAGWVSLAKVNKL